MELIRRSGLFTKPLGPAGVERSEPPFANPPPIFGEEGKMPILPISEDKVELREKPNHPSVTYRRKEGDTFLSLSVRKLLSLEKETGQSSNIPFFFLKRRTKTTAATPQIQPSFWVGGEGGGWKMLSPPLSPAKNSLGRDLMVSFKTRRRRKEMEKSRMKLLLFFFFFRILPPSSQSTWGRQRL